MITFDFISAKMKHSAWKIKMQGFIDGKSSMSETEAVSHRDCDLGKWMYAEGLSKYGSLPSMQELERVHTELHGYVKDIVVLKNAGDLPGAQNKFESLSTTSSRIIKLLDQLETQVKSM